MLKSFYSLFNRLNGFTLNADTEEELNTEVGGTLNQEIMQRLRSAAKRVRETGRKGKVTLTIGIEHAGMNQLEIDAEVKSKEPKSTLPTRILFGDDQGNLHAKDPKQQEMEFDGNGEAGLRSVQ